MSFTYIIDLDSWLYIIDYMIISQTHTVVTVQNNSIYRRKIVTGRRRQSTVTDFVHVFFKGDWLVFYCLLIECDCVRIIEWYIGIQDK